MPMALVLENAMVIHVGGVFHRPAMQLLGLLPVLLALIATLTEETKKTAIATTSEDIERMDALIADKSAVNAA